MKKKETTKPIETGKVDEYMQNADYPMINVMEALRKVILSTDEEIGEEVKWNAPAFFYMGEMKPFDPKEYKRHVVVFNMANKDCIRLVFPSGAKVNDTSGLLEGDYKDGRRLAIFYNFKDVTSKEKQLRAVIKTWLELLEK